MARSIPALVKPALLVWARDRAGFALERVAEKTGLEVATLREWEDGKSQPSIAQLRKLGALYKRPLAVFFLPEPPKDFDPQAEFRRLPGVTLRTESAELRLALRLALFRREVARELYELLGEELPTIKAEAQPGEDEEIVGTRIRNLLGIPWIDQVSWRSAHAGLNAWRSAVEAQGVLVFQTGDVELDEMRGTSVPHGPLPIILINSSDAPHGRIFTLIHEFAHILLTNAGHRTSSMEGRRLPEDQVLERVSNRFAAAALLPKTEFLAEAAQYDDALEGDEETLRRFANRVKASPEAILRRLVSLQRVPASLYREKRTLWAKKPWFSSPVGAGGPPIEVRVLSSLGRPFTSLVLEGYERNAVSSADAADYLGMQLKYFPKLSAQLATAPF